MVSEEIDMNKQRAIRTLNSLKMKYLLKIPSESKKYSLFDQA